MERMQEIMRQSEFSQRRLGFLIRARDRLAEKLNIRLIPEQNEKLYAQYAELFGRMDEAIVAEARSLVEMYDGIAEIATEEAKCLIEILRDQRKAT